MDEDIRDSTIRLQEAQPSPPRDSLSLISFSSWEGFDGERWILHSDAVFDELLLPMDTMEQLWRDPRAVVVAMESAEERINGIWEGSDGLIPVEGQSLERGSTIEDPDSAISVDSEEEQIQERLAALLDHQSFFTSRVAFESIRSLAWFPIRDELQGGLSQKDGPFLPIYFQQALTGMSRVTDEDDQDALYERWSPEGIIPVTTPPITPPLRSDSFNPSEHSILSQNLLSILQRQSFIASPLPRWTAPPQWLQFETLRTFDEGLMTDTIQNTIGVSAYSTYEIETRTEIQTNLQGLLQNRTENSFISAPPQRWEQPAQWLQASMDETAGPGLTVRPDESFADGLIMAPPRVNDPSSTPSVTCNFGVMQMVGFGERKLEFFAETFSAMDAPFFKHRLRSQASNTTDLMFLVITDWQPWFKNSLHDALPDFPTQTVSNFTSPQVSSMLPSIDYNEGELTCIMDHINTHRKPRSKVANEREIDVGTAKALCLPLIVWTRARGSIDSHPDRPLIVVISKRTDKITSKIIDHYSNDRHKRWDRLTKNQAWVYLDLYFLFTKWDRVWAAVKHTQQKRTEEVYARHNVLPIVQQTRHLHKDNNIMISLREHVRIHKASLKIVMQRVEYMLGGVDFMETQGLKGRLDDAYQLLEYYEVTATTLLEQQQNLLSLAFNLETVAQGAAVARLNALAFVFLPLSFVASVFGITTFTADPMWYPVAAVPVLLTTLVVAYAAHRFFSSRTTKDVAQVKEQQPMPSSDLEKMPTLNTIVSAPIWKTVTQVLRKRRTNIVKPTTEIIGPWAIESTSVNDPSRLIRRSTERPIAAINYVPPRSTVHFIPGAYDVSSAGPSFYSSVPSQILGSQSYDFATATSPGPTYVPNYYGPFSLGPEVQRPSDDVPDQHNTEPVEIDSTPLPQIEPPRAIYVPSLGAPVEPEVLATRQYEVSDIGESVMGDSEILRGRAVMNFYATKPGDLFFGVGDVVTLINKPPPYAGWAHGQIGQRSGIFPLSAVQTISSAVAPPRIPASVYIPSSIDNESVFNRVDTPGPAPLSATYPNYNYLSANIYTPSIPDLYTSTPTQSPTTIRPRSIQIDEIDETGYRHDAPDYFGLPPEGFSDAFAGRTADNLATGTVAAPNVYGTRFGGVFGDLDGMLLGAGEGPRLEIIPEEDTDEGEGEEDEVEVKGK